MTEAPLRANPEDRPLPPSGDGPALPPLPLEARHPPAARAGAQTRPIGRIAGPPRDWRGAWSGFAVGMAALLLAVGLAWLLWDLAGTLPAAPAPAAPLTRIELAEIEALLDGLGFPPGEVDGVIDANGATAIRDFQITAGLPADGAPSSALLEELRAAQVELTGGQ